MEKIQPVVMAKRLEMWPLERLRPYERNARTHSDEQLQQIAASIRMFGFTAPILVDGSDGVVAGHGRLTAAKLLGLAEVPVVVLDHLSEEQRRQYVLADNKLAENAGWDLELLALELEAVEIDPAVLGFGEADLARLQDGLELGEFEQVAATGPETERAEPEDQPGLGLEPRDGEFEGSEEKDEEDDEPINRGVALAIVLTPEELRQWREAKAELGYSKDKTAFWKLVQDFMEEVRNG